MLSMNNKGMIEAYAHQGYLLSMPRLYHRAAGEKRHVGKSVGGKERSEHKKLCQRFFWGFGCICFAEMYLRVHHNRVIKRKANHYINRDISRNNLLCKIPDTLKMCDPLSVRACSHNWYNNRLLCKNNTYYIQRMFRLQSISIAAGGEYSLE